MRYRSTLAPALLILGLAVTFGCDEQPAQSDVFDETQAPKQNELEEIRWRCQAFLSEHNPELSVQGFNFNQLTPNVYMVNAEVTDNNTHSKYTKQLSVEKLKDVSEDEDGDLHEMDAKVYAIDYADPFKMAQIAERHGFASEVRSVHDHNVRMAGYNAGYVDNWMDDYLLWSTIYHRPAPMYYGYGMGFQPRPLGFRPYAPMAPINVAAVRSPNAGFGWIAAQNSGRSSAFSSGLSRNPPNVTHLQGSSGAKVFSSAGGKGVSVSSARGGFGGHASSGTGS
jgi:hypothetical protein